MPGTEGETVPEQLSVGCAAVDMQSKRIGGFLPPIV